MKFKSFIFLALSVANVAIAQEPLSTTALTVPFNNEHIFTTRHMALTFNYDMSGVPAKKVVCELSQVNKGRLVYFNQGNIGMSPAHNGSGTVILTSLGKTEGNQFRADATGFAKIRDEFNQNAAQAVASCHYAIDESKKQ